MGSRSRLYTQALLGTYRDHGELVGICDPNATRLRWHNEQFKREFAHAPVATYQPQGFGRMLSEQKVEVVIVTSVDRTHHRYIVEGVRGGCDVITEKPLTIDAAGCQAIVDAVRETGRKVTVCFNYRYAPRNARVKRLLAEGAIGTVLSANFEWLLDTRHGADYFRRWHRDKRSSGGLMIHKASHHFDLVNWWLGARPETVFGFGRLGFYGRQNGEARGEARSYERATGSAAAADDPFALHLDRDPELKGMYLEAEGDDGYLRDRNVFADGISIEDDMGLVVRYSTGAILTYHLVAYAPGEGYRISFNGSKGRLELEAIERTHVNSPLAADAGQTPEAPPRNRVRIMLRRHWREPESVDLEEFEDEGTHSAADTRLLAELFGDRGVEDPLASPADHRDGVLAVLPGIAANLAFLRWLPVDVGGLVTL